MLDDGKYGCQAKIVRDESSRGTVLRKHGNERRLRYIALQWSSSLYPTPGSNRSEYWRELHVVSLYRRPSERKHDGNRWRGIPRSQQSCFRSRQLRQ